jgi:hypothetical protein
MVSALPGPPMGLIVNPSARGVKRRYLQREPFWQRLVPPEFVRVTGSLDELDQAIAGFREAGVRSVAVLGGDGSAHHLVDAVVRGYSEPDLPMLLVLAGGTMNGLPKALNTGGNPEHVLQAILAALAGGTPAVRARHVLRVTDGRDGRVRYGFSFANGVVYRVARRYYRSAEPGMLDMLRASLLPIKAALFGGRFDDHVKIDLHGDGEPWLPGELHTVVASVLENPLFWFTPFGVGLGDPAVVHLCATSMRAREMAPRLWSILRGRCEHPRLRVGHVREALVRGDTGYFLDGDLYPCDGVVDVRITVGPRVRFLIPG